MTPRAPADKTAARTSSDETGDSPLHGAAFDKDIHQTPKVLWLSVAVMCLGVALIGGGVVALSRSTGTAVALFVAGAVVGAIGAVIGWANNIMSNVE